MTKSDTKRFWICRRVDPIAENNEHYHNWWEYRWVSDPQWQRLHNHSHRSRHRWRLIKDQFQEPELTSPVHQARTRTVE